MSGASILVYAERVGGSLSEIEKLLKGPLKDFSGIHVLPFFHPYDGDDWVTGLTSSESRKLTNLPLT